MSIELTENLQIDILCKTQDSWQEVDPDEYSYEASYICSVPLLPDPALSCWMQC
jgi:hypothetical protein